MKLERFTIEEFVGLTTNPAEGLAQTAPTELFNLIFDRAGGYLPFGDDTAAFGVALNNDTVVGYDDMGFYSFHNGAGTYYLRKASTQSTLVLTNMLGVGHYDGAGLISGKTQGQTLAHQVILDDGGTRYTSASVGFSAGPTGSSGASSGTIPDATYYVYLVGTRVIRGIEYVVAQVAEKATVSGGGGTGKITMTLSSTNVENLYLLIGTVEDEVIPGVITLLNYTDTMVSTKLASVNPETGASFDIEAIPTTVSPFGVDSDGQAYLIGGSENIKASHRRRYWTVNGYIGRVGNHSWSYDSSQSREEYGGWGIFLGFAAPRQSDLTLQYSDIGKGNVASIENYIEIDAQSSDQITGLLSTPAGLLVFCDHETFLVRSDPALADFEVVRLTGAVGHDANASRPTRLGNVAFCIYNGEVWSISLGAGDVDFSQGLARVSAAIDDRADPFLSVAHDSSNGQVVACRADACYRFDPERQWWFGDVVKPHSAGQLTPIPSPDGTYYIEDDEYWGKPTVGSTFDAPALKFSALDLGDKNLLKLWRRVELFTDILYAGAPTMTYTVRGASASVSGIDQGDGRWVFTFPPGIVGPTADLRFSFPSVGANTIIEPPLHIYYVPRYREV